MQIQEVLRLGLVQTALHWEAPRQNFELFADRLASLPAVDLVLLPEMFSTGFSMKPHLLADSSGKTLAWLQEQAARHQFAISGSAIVAEGGHYYNRLYFVCVDGSYYSYDKRHLFSLAGEEKVYRAGIEKLVLNFKGWRINPQICYDLRFPVWCRNSEDFDFQFFVANWPERRSKAWKSLLQARAIENMCYLAGLNRVGEDGNGVAHSGDSRVFDPLGESLCELPPHKSSEAVVELSYAHLQAQRQRFAFLKDRDAFTLHPQDGKR